MAQESGFTLLEALTALTLIAGVIAASASAYSVAKRTVSASAQEEQAWHAVLSQENALRALPYASLTARTFHLDLAELPEGRGVVQVRQVIGLNAFEITLEAYWAGPNGERHLSHAYIISPYAESTHAAAH